MKISTFLIILMIQINQAQECTTGCLSCGKSSASEPQPNICVLPDIVQGYYIDQVNKSLKKKDLISCQELAIDGKCLKCSKSYSLDTGTGNCIKVEINQQIQNCEVYSNSNCSQCQRGFLIQNNACQSDTANQIANCKYQFMDANIKKCSQCDDFYFLNPDQTSCVEAKTRDSSCYLYELIKCEECNTGYIQDETQSQLLLEQHFSNSNFSHFRSLIQKQKNSVIQANLSQVCFQKPSISNCLVTSDGKECQMCNNLYHLSADKKSCVKNPISGIDYCEKYHSLTVCKNCQQGYYWDGVKCTSVTQVQFCRLYISGTLQQGIINHCLECEQEYYLNNGVCTQRTMSISNCIKMNPTAEKCSLCDDDYILNDNLDKCFFKIKNCQQHNTNVDSTELQIDFKCTKCIDGFYLNNEACVPITITNCIEQDGNECDRCANRFYPRQTCTHEGPDIPSCEVYNGSDPYKCSQCNANTYLMQISNECVRKNEIPGCATYYQRADQIFCEICMDNYYLFESKCYLIAENSTIDNPNCQKLDFQIKICIECKSGYGFDADNKCIDQTTIMDKQTNCHAYSINQSNLVINGQCALCEQRYYPFNFQNRFFCIHKKYLDFEEILHCEVYKDNGFSPGSLCKKCKDNYRLNTSQNGCMIKCQNALQMMSYDIDTGNNNKVSVSNLNQCVNGLPESILAPMITQNTTATTVEYITIQCKQGTLTERHFNILTQIDLTFLQTFVTEYTNFNPANVDSNIKIDTINDVYPKQYCEVSISSFKIDGEGTTGLPTIKNSVEIFMMTAADEATSMRCPLGKQSAPLETNYLKDCSVNCQSTSQLKGLNPYLQSVFSCTMCPTVTGQDNIPILIYKESAPEIFESWISVDLSQATIIDAPLTTKSSNIVCMDNTSAATMKSSFLTQADEALLKILENCALATFEVGDGVQSTIDNTEWDDAAGDATKQRIKCAACKPGYKPTLSTDPALYVTHVYACTVIDNCDTNGLTHVNICTKCNNNFSFKFANDMVDFTVCQASTLLTNCFASVSATECAICNKGYDLNDKDKKCIVKKSTFCKNEDYQLMMATQQTFEGFYFNQYATVCYEGCAVDYIGMSNLPYSYLEMFGGNLMQNYNFCVTTDQLKNQSLPPNITNFIANCKHYEAREYSDANGIYFKCGVCEDSYLISSDKKNCYQKNTDLNFCEFASSANSCSQCLKEYSLVNNKCQANNINNCSTVKYNQNNSVVTCDTCASEYYLLNNNCVSGQIKNCLSYDNTGKCLECKSGYWLLEDDNFTKETGSLITITQMCLMKKPNSNCKTVKWYHNDTFSCQTCELPWDIKTDLGDDQLKTVCMNFEQIPNCKSYNNTFANRPFDCNLCQDGYYLSSSRTCTQRSNTHEECLVYSINQDQCTSCKDEFYLDGSNCKQIPSGLEGCLKYENTFSCAQCTDTYYLNADTKRCIKVTTAVSNCMIHKDDTQCEKCKENYSLKSDNTCQQNNVSNCMDFETHDSCKVCNSGFVIKVETTGKKTCESFTITNCSVIDYSSKSCTECNQNYYPQSSTTCTQVTQTITNCLVNISATKCQRCNNGHYLSLDQTKCISLASFDAQCKIMKEIEPVCKVCHLGHKLEGGKCVKTESKPNCALENSQDCLVCLSGYYMNYAQQCIGNTSTTTPTGTTNPKFLSILLVEMIMVLFL